MNEILKRCIEELSAPTPRTDRVLGMLEALLATNRDNHTFTTTTFPTTHTVSNATTTGTSSFPGPHDDEVLADEEMDEGKMLEGLARAGLPKIVKEV